MNLTETLPLVNAILNGSSFVFLVTGLAAIKSGRRELHERLMIGALTVSALFLASYLYYHFVVLPDVGHTKFNRPGFVKTAYYVMLVSHIFLAVVNLPMVIRVVYLAKRERWEAHKRLAKVTFPIWLYVSVTGVLVYLALYVWNVPAP
jgi:uncharacterized membrane protein YozB (DUF420 family)